MSAVCQAKCFGLTYLFGNGIDEPLVVRDDNDASVPAL